ncbi:MAG: hypothetical protein ACK478_07075 [Flavobacteriales bacterium]|jgi:hypothetical protein
MSNHRKFIIAIIAAFAAGVGYNLYLINNGNTDIAVFGGPVITVFAAACFYYFSRYFERKKG